MNIAILKSFIAVAVGSIAYGLATSAALPWAPLFSPAAGYASLQLANTVMLAAVSAPFALALVWPAFRLNSPVFLALCIACLGLLAPVLSGLHLVLGPGTAGVSAAIDLVKFAVTLPLLTWLAARWLPSNNSSKPTPLRGAA